MQLVLRNKMEASKKYRSYCPQYLGLEVFGDKWSLLIIRDMMIDGKRYFREFLQSEEKIASNILANRLEALEAEGIIVKRADPAHKQKIIYSLTEKGIDLFPILMEIARWSLKYKPVDPEKAERAEKLMERSTQARQTIIEALKKEHMHPGF